MKHTLIGYHVHQPDSTGVRPRAQRVFLGTAVHIPPPRIHPRGAHITQRSRVDAVEPSRAEPSAIEQVMAGLAVCYLLAIGVAIMRWL
jgi:hypothetical protein